MRICITASVLVTVSLILSCSIPLWQLLLGPIMLGIPHVIGDVRYLVLREGLQRRRWFWFGVGLPFFLFIISAKPVFAMMGVVVAASFSRRNTTEKYLAVAFSSILLYLSFYHPRNFLFAFLHIHNLVGIAIWWFWKPKRKPYEAIPLLICALGIALILFGPLSFDSTTSYFPPQLDAAYFERNLAGFAEPAWQLRWVILYAFLQSVHYGVWIRLIPEEARKQPTPRSFHQSLRALQKDFGTYFVIGSFIAMLLLVAYAAFDPKEARYQYLYLISFHGFLELAFCVYTRTKA